jgi:hypothetical protein
VTAGEHIQLNDGAVNAAEYNSPSMPGKEEEAGKKAMKLGDCLLIVSVEEIQNAGIYQWVRPGIIFDSMSF